MITPKIVSEGTVTQGKDYDEGSAAFAERRKPEFQQEYYDGKTKPPGVP